ncbi:MAG: hypothetical protein AB8B85_19815 [Paracoccaceae bacterium]
MRLRAKMIGVAIYAVIATAAVLVSGDMMVEAHSPVAQMQGKDCPAGHLKG